MPEINFIDLSTRVINLPSEIMLKYPSTQAIDVQELDSRRHQMQSE